MAKVELRTVSIEDTEHYPGAHIKISRIDDIYVKLTVTPVAENEDPTDLFVIESELIDLHIAIGQFLELKAQEQKSAKMTNYLEHKKEES
jgi:hypothetical protein